MHVDRDRFLRLVGLLAAAACSACATPSPPPPPPPPTVSLEPVDASAPAVEASVEAAAPPDTSEAAAMADLGPWGTDKEPSPTWNWGPVDECCAPLPRRGGRTCEHGKVPATAPVCAWSSEPCSSPKERALTCAGALRYLQPSVAANTVECLRDLWGCTNALGVFHCAEHSLLRECEDGPVEAECHAIAAACPALARRVCGAWLSGMNEEGRANMVACLTTPKGCAEGPAECAMDLLSASSASGSRRRRGRP